MCFLTTCKYEKHFIYFTFTTDNAKYAHELIGVLRELKVPIPPQLEEMPVATFDFGLALGGPKGQGSFTVKLGVEFGGSDDMGEAMKLTILSMNLLMKNMVCMAIRVWLHVLTSILYK